MEIEITSLKGMDCFALSHSRMEGGENAGRNTWNASKAQALETPLLDTEEKLQAMRDFALSSGGWDQEEIDSWPSEEINALFLQWIAGDCREAGAEYLSEINWRKYRQDSEQGRVSSNLFKSGRKIYFYLGN